MGQRMNVALKTAIVQSGKKQKRIARLAGLSEHRLSSIVHQRIEPHDDEVEALVDVLGRDKSELFPSEAA